MGEPLKRNVRLLLKYDESRIVQSLAPTVLVQDERAPWHWVTAYSVDDAKNLMDEAARRSGWDYEVLEMIEDVDVRDLDQGHVVPNMGPPNLRGNWYPNLNLR